MQRKTAETPDNAPSAARSAEDEAINAQLVGIIKANTVRLNPESAPHPHDRQLTYFEAARAFIGLLTLMVAAYIYGLMVKKEA
jgi:hypothetical protein